MCFGWSPQGLGQERDDIQELEELWLAAQGRRRGSGAPHSQTAGANPRTLTLLHVMHAEACPYLDKQAMRESDGSVYMHYMKRGR